MNREQTNPQESVLGVFHHGDYLCDGDDYFPPGVPFSKIAESFSSLSKRIMSIYNGFYSPGFKKLFDIRQISLVYFRRQSTHFQTFIP